jgi:UDP-N-acetylglucosamine 2-epimerase (non-hydrolysing)
MQKIYFFIGTKAQAIKCISLINLLSMKSNLSVFIVNSGQHTEITQSIFNNLKYEVTYLNLFSNTKNVSKYTTGFFWMVKFFIKYIIINSLNLESQKNKSICIVHGDTISTLMGLFWGKRNKFKVLHLESGLTSNSILNPFPEEIIRRITARISDILICFDSDSYTRLKNKFKNKYIFQVSENTIIETLGTIENRDNNKKDIVTATLHRTENILSKKILIGFIKLLEKLTHNYEVNWYLHEPTINALSKFKINIPKNINTFNLLSHKDFINEIKLSKLVITDGGSIQEECFYLGTTTILWRKTTERPYALNKNMYISNFNIKDSYLFVLKNQNNNIIFENKKTTPSLEIYDYLLQNKLILND